MRFCDGNEGLYKEAPPLTPLKLFIRLTDECASAAVPKPGPLGMPLSLVLLGEVLLGREGMSLFHGLVPQTFWASEFAWKALPLVEVSVGSVTAWAVSAGKGQKRHVNCGVSNLWNRGKDPGCECWGKRRRYSRYFWSGRDCLS